MAIVETANPCNLSINQGLTTFVLNLAESLGVDSTDPDILKVLTELQDQIGRAYKGWKDKTNVLLAEGGAYSLMLVGILAADLLGFDPNVIFNPIGYINSLAFTTLIIQFMGMVFSMGEAPFYFLLYKSIVTLEEQLNARIEIIRPRRTRKKIPRDWN